MTCWRCSSSAEVRAPVEHLIEFAALDVGVVHPTVWRGQLVSVERVPQDFDGVGDRPVSGDLDVVVPLFEFVPVGPDLVDLDGHVEPDVLEHRAGDAGRVLSFSTTPTPTAAARL